MGAGAPVLAFDVEFNREVTAGEAFFWADTQQLTQIVDDIAGSQDLSGDEEINETLACFVKHGRQRIHDHYQWDDVAKKYEEMLTSLATKAASRAH